MPRRGYSNNSLADNPYVGIDVDYFDKKALEKQQRHDLARENFSKFSQDVANQSYLDPKAREEYLKMQDQYYEDVLNKYSGNLSAGYQDILGAIEKSKNNPYHNLNKRHVEQAKIQQELNAQYGSEAIDLSTMPSDLYTKKKDGTVEWIDPNAIGAKVIKADDYYKEIVDILYKTNPHEFATQSKLSGDSGNAYYLVSKIQDNKTLTKEELYQLASNPIIQQTLRANATTSGVDNRQVNGLGKTYQEMFKDPEALTNFIYGNIQQLSVDEQKQKYEFLADHGDLENLRASHAKDLAKYEDYLKKVNEAGVTFDIPIGNQKVDSNTVADISKKAQENTQLEQKLFTEIDNKSKEISGILGVAPNFVGGKGNGYGDVVVLKDSEGNLDMTKIQASLNKKYGIDPNASVNPNSEIGQKIQDDITRIENRFKEVNDLERDRRRFESNLNDNRNLLNNINETVYVNTFQELKNSQDSQILNKYGIKNSKDLEKFISNPSNSSTDMARDKIRLNNIKNENIEKGVTLDQTYNVLANESEKAMTNRIKKAIGDKTTEVGVDKVLGMFTNSEGKDLGSFTMMSKDGSWANPNSYGKESLNDKLTKLKSDGNTFELVPFVSSPDGNDLKYHLKIKVFDKDHKELTEKEMFVPNAKLNPNYSNLEQEITTANQTEAINGYLTDPNYKQENIARAHIMKGQTLAGNDIKYAIGDLSNPNVTKSARTVYFNLPEGQQTAIKIYKDVDGYYGVVGIDGQIVKSGSGQMPYKTKSISDIKAVANTLVGEAAYMYNPNINIEKQRVPRSTFDNNTSYSNHVYHKPDYSNVTTQDEPSTEQ